MYASDEALRRNLKLDDDRMSVDPKTPEEELEEGTEKSADDGAGVGEESESEDEDDGAKRYWAVRAKNGVSKAKKKNRLTRDLRLCFKKDVREVKGVERAGEYCNLCLQAKVSKAEAFFTGNVTTQRTHITRFHYQEYLKLCESKNIDPKAHAPHGWKKNDKYVDFNYQKIDGFTVATKKPPAVNKAGLKEFLLELIVDADLSFRFVDRPSLHRTIRYLCPKLNKSDIPGRTCIGNAVLEKVAKLDLIDMELIANIPSHISVIWDGWSTKRRRPFSSLSIQYISSPLPDDPYNWTLMNS
ncbi:hypothetical protein JOM56_006360 [Amanita muscaria]